MNARFPLGRLSRRRFVSARVALVALVLLSALLLVSASAPAGSGLVAAYSFDEGSGATAADASGNGHTAALLGATWDSGHSGNAVSLDGSSGSVSLGSLSTFYKSGFTFEAWVRSASASTEDAAIVGSWAGGSGNGGPMLWVDTRGVYELTLGNNGSAYLYSGIQPAVGSWQFVAGTYDGSTANIYVDGNLAASESFTGNVGDSDTWRVGAYSSSPAGFFNGLVDDVRIYSRALSPSELSADMNTAVAPDTTPPSAPGTLTATGAIGGASLAWGAATDDFAVTKYDVYRSTTSGFTPTVSNRIAQIAGTQTSYVDGGLSAGAYYYRVAAEDQAGHVGAPSNEASATVTANTPPSVSITAPTGGTVSGSVAVTANAGDDVGVSSVQFQVDGQSEGGADTSAPYVFNWDTRGELNGSHTLTAVAQDAAGLTTTSAPVTVTVSNAASGTPPIAQYPLDETGGTTAHDSSANNSHGTLNGGAGWSGSGRYGGALSLGGSGAYVGLPGIGTFYKTAFTFEAWVRSASASPSDAAIVGTWTGDANGGPMLWLDGSGVYELTLGKNGSSYVYSGVKPPVGTWQFVVGTYDGSTARIYVDGSLASSSSFTGNVGDSNSWRIGAYGTTATGFFNGLVDNVRIYNRALSSTEIQTDMASRVPAADTSPPTAPSSLSAAGAIGKATLSWGGATDNVGVNGYDVYRSTISGFTPSAANRIAQLAATATGYVDTPIAGTYYYVVDAFDRAGNTGAPSNQASAIVGGDTTAPSVSITTPTGGSTVSNIVTITASASDNVSVVGVQFKLDGQNLGSEDAASPYTLSWDTRGELNGSHTLTAVARDGAGNVKTSTSVTVTVSNTGVSPTGIQASYGLDQTSGSLALDSSGNSNTGTLTSTGATWSTTARFGGALSLDGAAGEVELPAGLGTFYKTAFTLEAWVRKQSTKTDTAVVGSWTGSGHGGPMIWVDGAGQYELTLGNNAPNYVDSNKSVNPGQWQFVAATYDGATASIYVDGVLASSAPFAGNVGDSAAWRIGAYGDTPGGFFDGLIDNVRIYSRALSAAEVQTDMASRIQPDRTPPVVKSFTPANGSTSVTVGPTVSAQFSEPMQASTITSSTFTLRDSSNNLIASTVSYNPSTNTASLVPNAALSLGTTYRATLSAGGASDLAGNALAAAVTTSFTTASSPPPILLVTSASNPFSSYMAEILRNEGLDEFWMVDSSFLSSSLLNNFNVVVLGNTTLTTSQVSLLTSWVTSGGNLVAMRPDKKLAPLLGLTDAGTTLSDAYLKVNTAAAPGTGIVGVTIQYHGTADRYTLNGATSVATLYSTSSTATSNPAVTLRSVGSSGGQAAAFTFDLAQSVVDTRQGNPAWAGQDRDGTVGVRPDDLFYPSWLDTSKIAIPQADEQQRLFVNLVTLMSRDKLPLPHFWYLPRGLKAAIVMSGDDHGEVGNTASNFDWYMDNSPAGCSVALWQCLRETSYVFTDTPLTDAQAKVYLADGFEIALHPYTHGGCAFPASTLSDLNSAFDTQLAAFKARYPDLPAPVTNRTHCVEWPDWLSMANVELAHGMRLDANYYQFPDTWLANLPGFMNGGGFPMRFADTNGQAIDIYQEMTNMADDSGQDIPSTVAALLDNALNSNGFYGTFGANVHNDFAAPQSDAAAIVAAAQSRGVPVISFKQLLDWTDGRNNSTLRAMSWNTVSRTFTFSTTAAAGATGLQTMLPTQGPSGTLSSVSCGGSSTPFTVQTIKGVPYGMFTTVTGTCTATYR